MCKIIRTLLCTQTLPCNGKDRTPNKGITGTSKLRGRDPSVPSCKCPRYIKVGIGRRTKRTVRIIDVEIVWSLTTELTIIERCAYSKGASLSETRISNFWLPGKERENIPNRPVCIVKVRNSSVVSTLMKKSTKELPSRKLQVHPCCISLTTPLYTRREFKAIYFTQSLLDFLGNTQWLNWKPSEPSLCE